VSRVRRRQGVKEGVGLWVLRERRDHLRIVFIRLFRVLVQCVLRLRFEAIPLSTTPTVLPTAFVRKFRSLGDLSIRRGLIANTLGNADAPSIARFLGYLLTRMDSDGIRPLYLDTITAILAPNALSRELRRDVYCRLADDRFAPVYLFLSDVIDPRPRTVSREFPYELEDEALGVRKSKARSSNLDTLKLVSADPDPEVIRILLDNPMVTGDLSLKVASLRPQNRASFLVMLSNPRFGIREIIQAAIVQNPFCPIRLAAATVPLLSRRHQDQVHESPSLDPRVRDAALCVMEP